MASLPPTRIILNVYELINSNTLTIEYVNAHLSNRHVTQLGSRSIDKKTNEYIYPVVDPSITREIFLNRIKKTYPELIVTPYNNILYFDHGMCFLKYAQKN